MKKYALIFAGLVACASSHSVSGIEPLEANPCATHGSTYESHAVEKSGNCGPVADTIINIDPDGTVNLTGPAVMCEAQQHNSCRARNSGCTFTFKGGECRLTQDVTFATDGSNGAGLETIYCSGSTENCISTYEIQYVRR